MREDGGATGAVVCVAGVWMCAVFLSIYSILRTERNGNTGTAAAE